MMSRLRTRSLPDLLLLELPSFAVSLLIAERLFKFHSFTLEALAFVALWFCFNELQTRALAFFRKKEERNS